MGAMVDTDGKEEAAVNEWLNADEGSSAISPAGYRISCSGDYIMRRLSRSWLTGYDTTGRTTNDLKHKGLFLLTWNNPLLNN